MANTTTSPNMGMPVPVVGTDPGPDWATNINACLSVVDGHNHSSGQGVQITPAGLNISADLPFGGNNATTLRSVRFQSQGSPISGGSDLDCLFVSGVDLYYRDGNGNTVRLTQSGAFSQVTSGAFVPVLTFTNTSGGTATFTTATTRGYYQQIGSIVHVMANYTVTVSAYSSVTAHYSFASALPISTTTLTVSGSFFSVFPSSQTTNSTALTADASNGAVDGNVTVTGNGSASLSVSYMYQIN